MGLNLTKPTDHHRPYPWATVLLAHALIGLVLTVELHAFMPIWQAATAVWVGYLLVWEVGVQRLGAGLLDALTDAAAVAAGAAYAIGASFTWPGYRWAVLVLFAALLGIGVWRRR